METLSLTVHRGSQEIGGTCIELACEGTRLILDCGLPLESIKVGESENIPKNTLMVPGLFADGPKIAGILLSHAHADHSGLIPESNPSIPIFAGRATFKMAMTGSIFAGQPRIEQARERFMEPGKQIFIGTFQVTPYFVDHSVFGACAFLIEVAGKRLLYTGDLRFHGRKPGMRRQLMKDCAEGGVDVVITEGTCLSRLTESRTFSESDLETTGAEVVALHQGLILVRFSPLNLDRFVSFLRIAKKSSREFVTDPYGAYVLMMARSEKVALPDPFDSDCIRVLVPDGYWETKPGKAIAAHRKNMKARQIRIEEVLCKPNRFLMLWRPSMIDSVFKGKWPSGALCLYSMWKGYLEQDRERDLQKSFDQFEIKQQLLHASGHASRPDLVAFLTELNASQIIVVHSEEPELMRETFPNVVDVTDGVPVTL